MSAWSFLRARPWTPTSSQRTFSSSAGSGASNSALRQARFPSNTPNALHVRTASGDVTGRSVGGDASVNSASGDLRLESIDGSAELATASGDIDVGLVAGDARVRSASGDVVIKAAEGSVGVRTASGDVRVDVLRRGSVEIDTASGDVELGVATGTAAWLDVQALSGRVSSTLEPSDTPGDDTETVSIHAHTLSGDIDLRRAPN